MRWNFTNVGEVTCALQQKVSLNQHYHFGFYSLSPGPYLRRECLQDQSFTIKHSYLHLTDHPLPASNNIVTSHKLKTSINIPLELTS